MTHWYYVETRDIGKFSVILDWTYEHAALGDCFDETVSDLESMIDRCNRGVDTHYIARVRAFYNGHEMGSSSLGSCYAYDCDPEDDMREGLGGYLEDMIQEAVDTATAEMLSLKSKLLEDFA